MRSVAGILGLIDAEGNYLLPWKGADQLVAICDTGIDRGDLADPHPAFAGSPPLLRPFGDSARDLHGHGTHMAGCIAGLFDAELRGIAPEARLLMQAVFETFDSPFGLRPPGMTPILEDAFARGCRVHSNSWSHLKSPGGRYTQAARELDAFVRTHPSMVVVTAAGNEGHFKKGKPVASTIRPPGTAKNTICAGACESVRPDVDATYREFFEARDAKLHDGAPAALLDRGWAEDPGSLALFSGRGPAQPGRTKPDLVAPATSVISARSRAADPLESVWRTGPAAEVLAGMDQLGILGGTSIAAAVVAGCCAVVREALERHWEIPEPPAALVKAALVNAAVPVLDPTDGLPGTPAPPAPPLPHPGCGWGRVSLTPFLEPGRLTFVAHEGLRASGGDQEAFEVPLDLVDGAALSATLVWTDPEAEVGKGDLASHLSLSVETAARQVAFDPIRDNVARLRIEKGPADGGQALIRVRALRTAGNAPQPFALALDNGFPLLP